MDHNDELPLDRHDLDQLQNIADWFRVFPNDDYHADALFLEDVISKVAPLVREVDRLNMVIASNRDVYREIMEGLEQLKQEDV